MLSRIVLLACAVGILAPVAGCQESLCHDAGIDSSGRYKIGVMDLYNEQSAFTYNGSLVVSAGGASRGTCAQMDGIGPGVSLELQAVGTVEDSTQTCKLIAANLLSAPSQIVQSDPFAQADQSYARNQIQQYALMYAAIGVTVSGCAGGLGLAILPGGPSGAFAPAVPGELPPALLYRIFTPSSGTCLACGDNFAIQIAKE
jgi:hypothetical protein